MLLCHLRGEMRLRIAQYERWVFSKGRGVLFLSIFFVFEVDQILLNGSGGPVIIIYFSEPFFNTLKISILYWLNYFVGFF